MTTLRTAAQQALELLGTWTNPPARLYRVMDNLRAALAQQAEPVQGKRAVFILTREINEYDQCGEYFVEVFNKKPSLSLLAENGVPPDRLEHVLKGGGRVGNEYEWFHLRAHNIKE